MHSLIKVTGLSLRQWDYLQTNVNHGHRFRSGEVRVCAEFEVSPDLNSLHVELPIVGLAVLMSVLQGVEEAAQAEAILTDAETIVGRVTEPTEAERMAEVALEEHEPPTPASFVYCGNYSAHVPHECGGTTRDGSVFTTTCEGVDAELDLLDEISERPSIERPDGC